MPSLPPGVTPLILSTNRLTTERQVSQVPRGCMPAGAHALDPEVNNSYYFFCFFMISSYVKFNLFAVGLELSLSASVDRLVTKFVISGSAVSFNCTLDESCVNQSIDWTHYSAADRKPVLWYRSSRYSSILEGSGVTVEEDLAGGWSVLSIPRVTFQARGRFICQVFGFQTCQMNFQLTVTGKICEMSFLYSQT